MTLNDIQDCKKNISIDDKTYTLQFDYTAYALVEKLCEKSIYQLRDEIFEGKTSLKQQLILLYCGMLRNHNDFDIEVLKNHPHIGHVLTQNLKSLLTAFFTPLLPPEFEKNLELAQ